MTEFNEGDLVLVKNDVIGPANQDMINYFGGRVFEIQERYYNGAGDIRYHLERTPMSQDCPPICCYIWAAQNLIPYRYRYADVDFDGIDELI